ncbi:MAG: Sec-independent protein translocase protein TatB [Actinomycetes bacterium]
MGNLGVSELLVIALLALLVFGPERLPELARNAGKALARFREETSKSVEELKRAADIEDLDRELRGLSRDLKDVRSSVMSSFAAAETGATQRAADRPPPFDPEAT